VVCNKKKSKKNRRYPLNKKKKLVTRYYTYQKTDPPAPNGHVTPMIQVPKPTHHYSDNQKHVDFKDFIVFNYMRNPKRIEIHFLS
jgi:hypothetical protein